MIRRHLLALRIGLVVSDALIAFLVFIGVSAVRFSPALVSPGPVAGSDDTDVIGSLTGTEVWSRMGIDLWLAAGIFALVWVLTLWVFGMYRPAARWRLRGEADGIIRTTLVVAMGTMAVLFWFHLDGVSRLFLGGLFLAEAAATFTSRVVLRNFFTWLRNRGRNHRFMLIVGTGPLATDFAEAVELRRTLGMRVIGHVDAGEAATPSSPTVLGSLADLERIFHDHVVDEVAVCLPPALATAAALVIRLAAEEGKTVRIPVDPLANAPHFTFEEPFEGFVVRSIVNDGQRELGLAIKRLMDILGSLAGLIVLSPLLLGVAVLIRIREGGPILFRQDRVGLHGRTFTILKFRSMVVDAEERLPEIAHLNERRGAAFKVAADPRVTGLGRVLRKTSIDELPQLINVVRGEMSLVGPRPPLPREVDAYDIWHRRRLSMKPGMTGLWQVEARGEPEFDRWVERDLDYIDRWSLLLDLRIMLMTLPAVVGRSGA